MVLEVTINRIIVDSASTVLDGMAETDIFSMALVVRKRKKHLH